MKKFKRFSFLFLLLVVIILSFTIYTNASQDDHGDIQEKTFNEVKFLESKLINISNTLNNIEYENYKISVEPISEELNKSSSSNSSENQKSGGDSGSSGSSSDSETSEKESDSQKNSQKYSLKTSGVLNSDSNINWDYIKSETEILSDSLSAITLDLYEISLNQADILNFNKEYDNLLTAVKNENKEDTLKELSMLYSYIPKFLKNCSDNEVYKTVINTKEQLFKAYCILDSENWNEINSSIQNGINIYSKLLTDASLKPDNQYNVNKAYIIINELQNSINLQDKEIFLIKYKNLLEELSNM